MVVGVVNIILKDDFEGLDMNFNGVIIGEGDVDEMFFDIIMGLSFDCGNVVIGL